MAVFVQTTNRMFFVLLQYLQYVRGWHFIAPWS